MTRAETIQQYEMINRKLEVKFMPAVKRALHVVVRGAISHLESGGYDAAKSWLHKQTANPALATVIRTLYSEVGTRHARRAYSAILLEQKGFGFNAAWTHWVLKYLDQFLLEKIAFEVATTTRDALLRTIQASIVAGLPVQTTVDNLKDWPYERFQAARIVRTEVNRAANVGSKAQAVTSEYQQMKEWISAQDNRVRGSKPHEHANHVALNGTVIDEGNSFTDSVNGDTLEFPGDPKASAASTINCRCQVAYTLKRDERGDPIPKRRSTTVIFPGQIPRPQIITI